MNSDQWEDNTEIHGGNHSVLAEEEEWQFKILLLSEEDEEIKKMKKKNDLADEKLDFALSYDILSSQGETGNSRLLFIRGMGGISKNRFQECTGCEGILLNELKKIKKD